MTEVERQHIFQAASRELLSAMPELWASYVYGSFVRGDESPDSDLDLAVLLPPGQSLPDRLALAGQVARRVHRDVDIVSLREAGLDLLRDVLLEGHLLALPRPAETLAWEAERMTDYAGKIATIVRCVRRARSHAPGRSDLRCDR